MVSFGAAAWRSQWGKDIGAPTAPPTFVVAFCKPTSPPPLAFITHAKNAARSVSVKTRLWRLFEIHDLFSAHAA